MEDDEEFIIAYRHLLDAKCQLMAETTSALVGASAAQAIVQAMRNATGDFQRFSSEYEDPFSHRYSKKLENPPSVDLFTERHRGIFQSFVSALQELKYGNSYAGNPEIAGSIAEFEWATAQIPETLS